MRRYFGQVTCEDLYDVVEKAIEDYIEVKGRPVSNKVRVELDARYEWEKDFDHFETDVEIIMDEDGKLQTIFEWDIFEGQTILSNLTIWSISYT